MNISLRKESNTKFLVYFLPLFFVFMPRPPISGVQFLTYPLLGGVLGFLIILVAKDLLRSKGLAAVVVLLTTYAVSISFSIIFSINPQNGSVFHVFKPILFIIILAFGYVVGSKYAKVEVESSLVKVSKMIMLAQLIVGIPQLLGVSLFDQVYNAELARPIGSLIRIVGTLANPNIFAWVVMFSTVTILLMEKNKKTKVLWIVLGAALIVLSGSRTSFVLFPAVLFVSMLLKTRKSMSFYFFKLPMYGIVLYLVFQMMIWLITKYQQTFPYLSQLLQILETGDLNSVNSFEMRTVIWDNVWNIMVQQNNIVNYLFGVGPNFSESTFTDNDFLYAIMNYGFVGLSLNLLLYGAAFYLFSKMKNRNLRVLGQQYIIFSLVIGMQAETISGWNYPIFLMFYLGVAIALKKKGEDYPETAVTTAKRKRILPKIVW